jgi:hypothetical protein
VCSGWVICYHRCLTCFKGLCCVCTQVSGSVVSNWPLCKFWTCVLWFFGIYIFIPQFFFWDTRRWIKSKSTIRSIPTHHRQNPTEIINNLDAVSYSLCVACFPTKGKCKLSTQNGKVFCLIMYLPFVYSICYVCDLLKNMHTINL